MQKQTINEHIQNEWERAIEQAARLPSQDDHLGEMLQEAAGLHIKSGVQAGDLWGTTSCSCETTCDCFPA